VVHLTPPRWPIAAGCDAPAVANDERAPQRTRNRPRRPADVDRHRSSLGDDPGHAGIAQQPLDRRDRQPPDVFRIGTGEATGTRRHATFDDLEVHHDREVRSVPSTGAGRVVPRAGAAQLDERVRALLRLRAEVAGRTRMLHRGVERTEQDLASFGFEHPVDSEHSVEQRRDM
jgi:hypothetical protein